MNKPFLKPLWTLCLCVSMFFFFANCEAQTIDGAALKKHVEFLASDKLNGRLTGSKDEAAASAYIVKEFEKLELKPRGVFDKEEGSYTSYLQPFNFTSGIVAGSNNSLLIARKKCKINEDYYPLPWSGNGEATGMVKYVKYGVMDTANHINDYEYSGDLNGKILLINLSSPDSSTSSPYNNFNDWRSRFEIAKAFHPSGIIFYHSKDNLNISTIKQFSKHVQEDIPLVYVEDEMAELLKDSGVMAKISVQWDKVTGTGHNVIGFLDNGSNKTVVIGAHYDHLGLGQFGSSLYALKEGEKPQIHNGADDNASGVASVIELARLLKSSPYKKNNYLFMAFSGEEEGLLGSASFTNNPTYPLEKINYMINLDMVGRLDSITRKLEIGGVGTSPTWDSVINKSDTANFTLKRGQSGYGPSDHSSFYLKNIPVLFVFTGLHEDYHRPSDDAWKINYRDMEKIGNYVYNIIGLLDNHTRLVFTKTKDNDNSKAKTYKITLGIMPDYMFEGRGVKITGASAGKPAEKAGLIAGDIIIRLGDRDVVDMQTYMQALAKFKKGDKTIVVVQRGIEQVKLPIEF